jgi:DNA repair protein RadC
VQPDTIRLRELTLRYDVKRDVDGHEIRVGPRLLSPKDSARLLMTVLQHQASEVFGILCLSTRHDVIAYHEVARGTLDSVVVEPREVFKPAILANAASLVLSHNYPSGNPSPSKDDFELTARLVTAESSSV